MTKKILAWKKFEKWYLSFFMSGIPHDLALKTENVPKWAFFDNIWNKTKDTLVPSAARDFRAQGKDCNLISLKLAI